MHLTPPGFIYLFIATPSQVFMHYHLSSLYPPPSLPAIPPPSGHHTLHMSVSFLPLLFFSFLAQPFHPFYPAPWFIFLTAGSLYFLPPSPNMEIILWNTIGWWLIINLKMLVPHGRKVSQRATDFPFAWLGSLPELRVQWRLGLLLHRFWKIARHTTQAKVS